MKYFTCIFVVIGLWVLAVQGQEMVFQMEYMIAKGNLLVVHTNPPMARSDWADYDITEFGHGGGPIGPMTFFFRHREVPPALPDSAILIINAMQIWDDKPPRYLLRGEEAEYHILPYSEELWNALRMQSQEELSDVPVDQQIPPEEAIRLAIQYLKGRDIQPDYLYLQPPLRKFCHWEIRGMYVFDKSELRRLKVRVVDNGYLQPFYENILYKDQWPPEGGWTDDAIEQAVAESHRNADPERWPYRVDPETGRAWVNTPSLERK